MCAVRVLGLRAYSVESADLRKLNQVILRARERISADQPWVADELLRHAQRMIRLDIGDGVDTTPRRRMESRGLHRNRKTRTEG
jgi:hypothetical protein